MQRNGMKFAVILAVALGVGLAEWVQAQDTPHADGAVHDHGAVAAHGGILANAEGHQFEVVFELRQTACLSARPSSFGIERAGLLPDAARKHTRSRTRSSL